MRFRIPLSRRAGVTLAAIAAAASLAAAAATVLYVNVDRLDIVDKKRAVSKTIVTVDRNTALNVIAQEGHWYKVEVGGKQGYAFQDAVATQPNAGGGKGVNLASVNSGKIQQLETAAAVKGVGDGARQYASGSHLNTNGLEEMIRRRDAITPQEFDQFVTAGGLPGESAAAGDGQAAFAAAVKK